MKKRQSNIPQFPLSPLSKAGILIKNMKEDDTCYDHENSTPHRDDHYLLMLATNGHFNINIDFQEIQVTAPALQLILPGQVHHIISIREPAGWLVSFDPALVNNESQPTLGKGFRHPLLLNQQSAFYDHAVTLMGQMEKLQTTGTNLHTVRANHSLLDAFLTLLTGEITGNDIDRKEKTNRGAIIEQAFMQLLKDHYKEWKEPARYAAALNISVAHLYDTIKYITGDSVSACIQQYVLLEAKRLLCFTQFTVKEIGSQLGYDEPVYFGKLFKKLTGLTPLQFRQQWQPA